MTRELLLWAVHESDLLQPEAASSLCLSVSFDSHTRAHAVFTLHKVHSAKWGELLILRGLKRGGVTEAAVSPAAVVHGAETSRWRQAECEETHFSLRSAWGRNKHSGRISRREQVHLKNKVNKQTKVLESAAVRPGG